MSFAFYWRQRIKKQQQQKTTVLHKHLIWEICISDNDDYLKCVHVSTRGCWITVLRAQRRAAVRVSQRASVVRICSSKPLADSNTVLLFKAISNMSCLTSFKSYLTLHNSCEFTVRIKGRNSQRGEKLSLSFCSAKGTWQGCLPRDEYIITHLQHNAFQRHEKGSWKSLPYIFISDIMENGIKTAH